MGEAYRALVEPLVGTGLEYMVTGGMAVALYGRPHLTEDIDIVVRVTPENVARLHAAYPAEEYELPAVDAIARQLAFPWRGGFHIVHRRTELRVHIHPAHDALHDWGFARRREEPLGEGKVWFVPVEYLLIRKMDTNRATETDRHLDDLLAILRARRDGIDMEAMERLAGERSLQTLWRIMLLNADNPRLRRLAEP